MLDTKKGIFYSFLFKCIVAIFSLSESKVERLVETAKADLKKELVSTGLDKFDVDEITFMKLAAV